MPETALLVIDMQKALLAEAHEAGACLRRVAGLAGRARSAGVPVVYLRQRLQAHGLSAEEQDIHPAVAPQADDVVLDKDSADSFLQTPLAEVLRERQIRRVIVTGFATECCVDSTSRAALARGYDLVLASDGHTTAERGRDEGLTAAQVVAHHNEIFAGIEYAARTISVTPAEQITLTTPPAPPPAAALAWAAETAGPGGSAHVVRRLAGGTHAETHLLSTSGPSGPRGEGEMVLRRFPPGDGAAAYEARVLAAVDGLDGWAPRLLAADPEGKRFGEPATLITRVPGEADIMPARPEAAAAELGRALARVHAVPASRLDGFRDGMAAALASSPRPEQAGPAAPIVAEHVDRLAAQQPVLTHYDFWSGNVLWDQGELTAVVDWSGASRAPRGFDVSWCRLDLILLHGPKAAEAFLHAYEEAAGEAVPDVTLWDLFALTKSHVSVESWRPNYEPLGRTDLTEEELRRRHTAWTTQCLRQWPRSSPTNAPQASRPN